MKRTLLVLLVILLAAGSTTAARTCTRPDPPYVLSRGFANLLVGWLEVPRGIIYENARVPVIGFVSGSVKGTLLTVWRELAGTVDVLSMGLSRRGLYCCRIPDFVWDAEWIPVAGEDMVTCRNVNCSPCGTCPMQKPGKCDKCAKQRPGKCGTCPGMAPSAPQCPAPLAGGQCPMAAGKCDRCPQGK